jgi:hypothetical protein
LISFAITISRFHFFTLADASPRQISALLLLLPDADAAWLQLFAVTTPLAAERRYFAAARHYDITFDADVTELPLMLRHTPAAIISSPLFAFDAAFHIEFFGHFAFIISFSSRFHRYYYFR